MSYAGGYARNIYGDNNYGGPVNKVRKKRGVSELF